MFYAEKMSIVNCVATFVIIGIGPSPRSGRGVRVAMTTDLRWFTEVFRVFFMSCFS